MKKVGSSTIARAEAFLFDGLRVLIDALEEATAAEVAERSDMVWMNRWEEGAGR